jgi:hypothetical protein
MSPIDPTFLLKQLEPAIRPAYLGTPPTGPTAPLEQQPFDELLASAKAGRLASGRDVSAAHEGEPISPEQFKRLAVAADRAEASGAQRAVLLLDGRALMLDVQTRTVSLELSASSALQKIDTVVYVPTEAEQIDTRPVGPPSGVAPRGVALQLDQAQHRPPSAA